MSDPVSIWHSAYRHPADWDMDFPPMSLPAMFEASAARWPDRSLIDFMGRKFSYAETLSGVHRVAAGLAALGVGKGDRVGLFCQPPSRFSIDCFVVVKSSAGLMTPGSSRFRP